MGFSRQEYWSGLPFPPPGDIPDPGIEPTCLTLQADSLPSEPPGGGLYLCVKGTLFLCELCQPCVSKVMFFVWVQGEILGSENSQHVGFCNM